LVNDSCELSGGKILKEETEPLTARNRAESTGLRVTRFDFNPLLLLQSCVSLVTGPSTSGKNDMPLSAVTMNVKHSTRAAHGPAFVNSETISTARNLRKTVKTIGMQQTLFNVTSLWQSLAHNQSSVSIWF
jgi:hypothetical protein